ncbi:serine/threonine-protein kinase [Novosphingobium tardum]|uniref:Serine/threonine-protein kinase n=1 Tax=Novosphingobium tardum TaxID=1538021 RepID=A0ABV8RNQ7_9SPHN
MSENTPKDETPAGAGGGDEATRFIPAGQADDKTRFVAGSAAGSVPPSTPSTPPAGQAAQPAGQARQIQIGDVLNHTYEVRRFIARGGMGEVFEGVNVNAEDDRVAIKVMLPHLAADPLVQAMFSKEAKTLTRLRHPGLVQYRLLGREPTLGVTYIVTEFVDGVNLSEVLRTLDAAPADQVAMLRRLAAALGAAHELDAIHRDIAPDNVLLEGGRLKDAKIIDFGIAKDLDPSSKTIVGEGFAGKLGYVAPEQLGSYNRSVGPWTDVYSLGLVMLAVAQKRDVDMGGSLADAFEKRQSIPDLSAAPEELRPVLARMLEPDPANRLRSMDEVLAALSGQGPETTGLHHAPRVHAGATVLTPDASPQRQGGGKGLLYGGIAAALVALAAGGWFMFGGGGGTSGGAGGGDGAASERAARTAILAGLPKVECSWLDIASLHAQGDTVDFALRGVAGKPAAAETQIDGLLAAAGLTAGKADFDDVSRIDVKDCGPIEAFRQIRDYDGNRLTVSQRKYEMKKLGANYADAGDLAAVPIVEIDLSDYDGDVGLFGLEESGEIQPIITSRSQLVPGDGIAEPRKDVFRLSVQTDHKGWSGVLLLKGKGPFDAKMLSKPAGESDRNQIDEFLDAADKREWKSEMIWYRTVDEQPG